MLASIAALPPLVCSAPLAAQGGCHVSCSTWRHLPCSTLALQPLALLHTCLAAQGNNPRLPRHA